MHTRTHAYLTHAYCSQTLTEPGGGGVGVFNNMYLQQTESLSSLISRHVTPQSADVSSDADVISQYSNSSFQVSTAFVPGEAWWTRGWAMGTLNSGFSVLRC